MKRVAFLINELGYGGIENQVISLADSLTDLYKVDIICLKRVVKDNFNKKINVTEISVKDSLFGIIYDNQLVKKLNPLLKDFDIIVVNDNAYNRVIDKLEINNKQVYYWLHSNNIDHKNKLTKYDNVILPNKYLNDGLKLENVLVIPNAISLPIKKCDYSVNNTLIFVGKINKNKHLDDLLKIMEIILRYDKNIVLNIIGDGEERVSLMESIKEKGLENNVNLMGSYLLEEVIDELIDSSVFVTTSDIETFNLSILQAMSVGLPVICFENNSSEALISNEIDGILIKNRDINEFADAIIELLNDFDKRQNIGGCAVEKSMNYDIFVIKREWIKLFK